MIQAAPRGSCPVGFCSSVGDASAHSIDPMMVACRAQGVPGCDCRECMTKSAPVFGDNWRGGAHAVRPLLKEGKYL